MNLDTNIKTVIIGIGNILLGDEGIGVKVIKKLEKLNLPSTVKLIDGATLGFSLLPIFEKYKNSKFIIIDAIKIETPKSKKDKFINTHSSKRLKETKTGIGEIYVIPLEKLYEMIGSDYKPLEFISFHQTGLLDVLTLLYLTSKIKIKGSLVGISIFDKGQNENILSFSLNLSKEIESKIPEIINIVKKNLAN